MPFHILPTRTAGAAENMALDFLLLQRYPDAGAPRFRHYEWRTQAFTFGYSQKIEFVRAQIPADERFDLTRRATGGGVVDHRNDWTYALVIPRGHALYDERATQSYRIIHECLAAALVQLGQPVAVKTECEPPTEGAECAIGPGVCFQRAELYDVVNTKTGAKVAGAAQKRNKHGLLFQGSVEKTAIGEIDWDYFSTRFTTGLAKAIAQEATETPWPELNEDEVSGIIEQYSATEWIEYR